MNRFRELRQGLEPVPSFTEFAKRVNCSDQQIRRIEKDRFNNPGIQLAYRIAGALGCSVEEVFPPEAA